MVTANYITISHQASEFSYDDACGIAREALADRQGGFVCLVLERVDKTTSAALAKLVALRRGLLRSGRDLQIIGLHGRAEGLYQVNRMTSPLPRERTIHQGSENSR
jgi:hypothetical protein